MSVTNASVATTPLLALGYTAGSAGNVSLAPVIQSGVTVTNGAWYKVANAIAGNVLSSTALPTIQQPSSGLIAWTDAINNAGNLVPGATINSNSTSIPGISNAGANALNALLQFNSATGNAIEGLATAGAVRQAAEQLRPEINGASTQSVMRVSDKVSNLIGAHLAEKNSIALSGSGADEESASGAIWMSVFDVHGSESTRQNVDGYTANAYGLLLGRDQMIDSTTRVGGALSYANSNVNDKGVNLGSHTNIDSYLATAYSTKHYDDWYMNGVLGVGKHDIGNTRNVLSNTVKGSYDAWQYSASVDAGKPVMVGTTTVTPVAALTYSYLNQGAYTETGTGALMVNTNGMNYVRSGLGATVSHPLSLSALNAHLEFRAMWNHDFASTMQNTTASFVGGNGSTFTTNGLGAARDGLDLGASLLLFGTGKALKHTLVLRYDVKIKDKYLSQVALLQAGFEF
ncbi:autotransporter outer membrane beta-barrel domain-containing protein [Glaciimonas sp. GG7]